MSPNYAIANDFAGYSVRRMAGRKRGPLEEKLWKSIIKEVRGRRGKNKEVAAAIGRTPQWVSEYMGGRQHANLDTALGLMRYLGWTVDKELRGFAAPENYDAIAACRDPEIVKVALWLYQAGQEARSMAVQLVAFATGHAGNSPSVGQTSGQHSSQPRIKSPSQGRRRRQ